MRRSVCALFFCAVVSAHLSAKSWESYTFYEQQTFDAGIFATHSLTAVFGGLFGAFLLAYLPEGANRVSQALFRTTLFPWTQYETFFRAPATPLTAPYDSALAGIGIVAGTSLGAYIFGQIYYERGSYPYALLGATAGSLTGAGLIAALLAGKAVIPPGYAFILAAIPAAIGAAWLYTVSVNRSRPPYEYSISCAPITYGEERGGIYQGVYCSLQF